MPSTKFPKSQAYVQWKQLREKDVSNPKPFQRRRSLHDFDDIAVMHEYSEAYEREHVLALSKQLRTYDESPVTLDGTASLKDETYDEGLATAAELLPIHMAVLKPPGSNGDYYLEFLFVTDWDTYQRLFDPLDKFLITWIPAPEIMPSFAKVEGEKDEQDRPSGWIAVVMEDSGVYSYAPLTIMLCRLEGAEIIQGTELDEEEQLFEGYGDQEVDYYTDENVETRC